MENFNQQAALAARLRYRSGIVEPTCGIAPCMTQANMIAVPKEWAYDFLLFAQRNPQPCPILDVTDAGSYHTALAIDADLRTDLPLYRLWENGQLVDEIKDATAIWEQHPSLVIFLIGCSFTFEWPLMEAGISIRHIEEKCNVPMYRTNRPCRKAGSFSGELVVSMRPIAAERIADAVLISGAFPGVHGAPLHIGDPAALGIDDIMKPDFGDAVTIKDGELPVFWACGVTPQAVLMASKLPFAITHAPGHMFITDVADSCYRV